MTKSSKDDTRFNVLAAELWCDVFTELVKAKASREKAIKISDEVVVLFWERFEK